MKVVVFAGWVGSVVMFRLHLIRRLMERGWEVVVVAPPGDAYFEAELKEAGVCFRPIILERAGANFLQDIRYFITVVRVLLKERPEMVFAYNIKPVIYGQLAAGLVRVRRRVALVPGLGVAFGARTGVRQRSGSGQKALPNQKRLLGGVLESLPPPHKIRALLCP